MFVSITDFVFASSESFATLLWGVFLVMLSLRLRAVRKASAAGAVTESEDTQDSLAVSS
jgi:hypothetical protein